MIQKSVKLLFILIITFTILVGCTNDLRDNSSSEAMSIDENQLGSN